MKEPNVTVENFCGGVQVTIERTLFMKMMNGGNITREHIVTMCTKEIM